MRIVATGCLATDEAGFDPELVESSPVVGHGDRQFENETPMFHLECDFPSLADLVFVFAPLCLLLTEPCAEILDC